MSEWVDIENTCVDLIAYLFPTLKCVIAYQNNQELPTPYCVINLLEMDSVTRESTSTFMTTFEQDGDESEGVSVTEQYEATVKFQFMGIDGSENLSAGYCRKLSTMLQTHSVIDFLNTRGIAFRRKSSFVRRPRFRDTKWYNSYELEVTLGIEIQTNIVVGSIDTVDITLNSGGTNTIDISLD